ncbi:hypothetical protein OG204_21700 [Streptomyces sp. NBC_01387]|uniref:hypothetical protein n=1 Tax=unclassified Streptomyces TaxID=2593676 RepID=UPI0020243926|nr:MULTISPECIES: hypothetical protein [unclassified Streptomyces]MCX4549062.1 hypothetical protein [Streptomyces sp. NBC_01500]WSC20639.1 hypothetical protein OIE60_13610 [Streptomyces sp. NBC_01766]WSV54668.1 hypothetical protein OG282_13665 [Streptomyces sp. NBC_01014]
MNVRRILTTAAAGSALLAAFAPAAQAADLGGTLSSTAQTTAAIGEQAKPVAEGVVGDNVGKKVHAVKGAVQAGGDALKAGNELLG